MARLDTHDQHFLASPRLVAELIGHTNIGPADTVYDLGAGSGVIASVLARRCRSVVAVEIELVALAKLTENTRQFSNVHVVARDMLQLTLPRADYKVFANPPFSLISQLVRRLTQAANPPRAIYLIVQRQFARKIVPSDSHFTGALGIQLAPLYRARIRKPLQPTDFTPPPAVETVLLELVERDEPLLAASQLGRYRDWVAEMFADYKSYRKLPFDETAVSPERKASELSPDDWLKLYQLAQNL